MVPSSLPVIHGAGGMELIDPLFQRVLINICKQRGIPVILDEVFAGIWRLGRETAAELLHCTPDIACYAKLLTGGMVPLAVTLATKVGNQIIEKILQLQCKADVVCNPMPTLCVMQSC
jgi:adenosylmethionine-8-amino-7-oxononanoate aminotransferase